MRRLPNSDTREVITTGAFQLFPLERVLKKGGETIKLGSRSFDVLLALADRPGEIVGRTELISKVWPNLFVEDVSLRVHIAALRKALEERDEGTPYIANVSGRGYRLIAPTSRTTISGAVEAGRAFHASYPLPQPLADMVGRHEEVRALCDKLLAGRFVTVVGPGGVGKTTVALSVAHSLLEEFAGAVCFVGLGPVGDPALLANSITSAFGLPVQAKDTLPDLVAHLQGKRVLLALDSCEHLIAEAATVAQRLFSESRDLYILATSREALRVEGEHIHILPSLISPPAAAKLTAAEALAYPSTQLFANRMASAGAGEVDLSDEEAQIVSGMCRKLGGNALAIELAAGRVGTFGIRDTAALLDSQFALLWPGRRTAPPRHQTLHATLDWSHNLLSETERVALRRLSVFPGSFSLDAAQALVRGDIAEAQAVDAILGLFSKSLASADTAGALTRYRLLDTTRAYARRKLEESGELESVQRQHALHFCDLLRATAANKTGPGGEEASPSDIDDIRTALRWAFGSGGDALVGVDIAAYSAPIWLSKALLAECREWLAKAAAAATGAGNATVPQQLRIQSASAAAELFTSGFTGKTRAAWGQTLEQASALGDLSTQFLSHLVLWGGEIRAAQYAEALNTAERCAALAREVSDTDAMAMSEWMLGHSMHHVARFDETRTHLQRYFGLETEAALLASVRTTGYDRHVDALGVLSNTLWIMGQPVQAKIWGERAVAEARSSGLAIPVGLAMSWAILNTHLSEPNVDPIERDAVDLLEQGRAHSIDSDSGFALCIMGLCQARRGQFDAGTPLISEGLRLLVSARMEAFNVLVLAHACELAVAAGRLDDALSWMSQLESIDRDYENWCSSEVLRIRGLLAHARGKPADAADCLYKALELARRQGALSWELRAALSLSKLVNEQRGTDEARKILEPVYVRFIEGHNSADLIRAKAFLDELKTASR